MPIEKDSDRYWHTTYINVAFVEEETEEVLAVFTEDTQLPIPEPGETVTLAQATETEDDGDAKDSDDGTLEEYGPAEYVVSDREYSYSLYERSIPDEVKEIRDVEDDFGLQTISNVIILLDPVENPEDVK